MGEMVLLDRAVKWRHIPRGFWQQQSKQLLLCGNTSASCAVKIKMSKKNK